jgi:hypothetical protein
MTPKMCRSRMLFRGLFLRAQPRLFAFRMVRTEAKLVIRKLAPDWAHSSVGGYCKLN